MSEMAAKGESGILKITVEASMDQIQTVTDFVNRQLEAYGCPERTRIQLDVAIDEIFGNIVRYAYGSEAGRWDELRACGRTQYPTYHEKVLTGAGAGKTKPSPPQ